MEEKEDIKSTNNYISFSEYTLYKSCPYKWFLQHVELLEEPTNEF